MSPLAEPGTRRQQNLLPGNCPNRTWDHQGNEREDMQPSPIFFTPQHEAFLRPENLASVGFHMAPCGCFFDPRIYRIEWAASSANLAPAPSVYKLSASCLGPTLPRSTFLLEPKSRLSCQVRDGAPPPLAPPPFPTNVVPAPDLEAEPCFWKEEEEKEGLLGGPDVARLEEPKALTEEEVKGEASLFLPDKVLLEVAMKLFDCSPADAEAQATSAGRGRGRGRMGPSASSSSPRNDIRSLHLPEELLSFDYSVPEASGLDFFLCDGETFLRTPPHQEEEQEGELEGQQDAAPT